MAELIREGLGYKNPAWLQCQKKPPILQTKLVFVIKKPCVICDAEIEYLCIIFV
jgi:hypothetical protein